MRCDRNVERRVQKTDREMTVNIEVATTQDWPGALGQRVLSQGLDSQDALCLYINSN